MFNFLFREAEYIHKPLGADAEGNDDELYVAKRFKPNSMKSFFCSLRH